ncbi:MAG: Hsp20/alpha crystallin family protein [Synechococcus sp.]
MLTLRQSPFDLFERLEQQVAQAERVPAAEVLENANSYIVRLELPGVDRASIDVKATDRTLVISAERHSTLTPDADSTAANTTTADTTPAQPLLSDFRPGTWGRSFRFAQTLDRDQLKATYRDGILTITAAKADNRTTVSIAVED